MPRLIFALASKNRSTLRDAPIKESRQKPFNLSFSPYLCVQLHQSKINNYDEEYLWLDKAVELLYY